MLEMFLIDYVAEMHEMKEENLKIIRTDRELKKKNRKLKKENRTLKTEKKNLTEENKQLNKANKKLNEQSEKQKELINDYKNRKVIKIVDRLKK